MGLRHVTLGDIFRRNAQLFPDGTVIVAGSNGSATANILSALNASPRGSRRKA
jgi:inactivated superfamily I helicase